MRYSQTDEEEKGEKNKGGGGRGERRGGDIGRKGEKMRAVNELYRVNYHTHTFFPIKPLMREDLPTLG